MLQSLNSLELDYVDERLHRLFSVSPIIHYMCFSYI